MNIPADAKGFSYIVSWKKIAHEDFLDEFCRITKSLIFADTQTAANDIMKRLPEDTRMRYWKIRRRMTECGYYVDNWQIPHFCGWDDPHLVGDKIQFRTTAPAPQRLISMRSYMDYKREQAGEGDEEMEFVEEG